ncbi:J domain-containing protein [Priestia megaterium]|uniref:J domain-containing protein n=1 Tax=Priestia megaterium TaxID=1404 RepID=UPI003D07EBB4
MFLLIVAIFILYFIFSNSGDSSSNSQRPVNSNSHLIDIHGSFHDGFYIEDIKVYVKGPISTYEMTSDYYLFAFGPGELKVNNSNAEVVINLEKTRSQRIVPANFFINKEKFPVINKQGRPDFSVIDLTNVDVTKTLCYMLDELNARDIDAIVIDVIFDYMTKIILYNMLINNSVITDYSIYSIEIHKNHYFNLLSTIEKYCNIIDKKLESYMGNYSEASKSQRIKQLLAILELPSDIDDIVTIKRQYKLLAKKYHPDLNHHSEQKMKEINLAYEELSELLQAS